MEFDVVQEEKGWIVRGERVTLGPYATGEKAIRAAANLNRRERWLELSPSQLAERIVRTGGRPS